MNQFKRTALSLAVAQVALICAGGALAQMAARKDDEKKPDTVVVTGQRAALQSAQKIKKDADEVVDSIVADDIGKLPDRSVTEVLQRVVGVTIDRTMAKNDPEHFSVEGSGVSIRGLPWVRSELNGRDSFSANGGRALNFEDVPPELMAGVDVYKNPSAEQIEGAIGGLVNLRTALPLDYPGMKASLSLQDTYTRLNKQHSPSYSALFSNRWDTAAGRFGALLHVASSESATRSDFFQVEPYYPRNDAVAGQDPATTLWVPKGAQWRTLEFDRKREGLYGALQWKTNDIDTSLTYFQSKYRMQWDERAIFAQSDPYRIRVTGGQFDGQGALLSGVITNSDGSLINFNDDTRTSWRNSKTEELAWRLKWKASERLSLSSDLQYIRANTSSFDSTVATGVGMPKQSLDLTGTIPSLSFDASDRAYLANPANYYWGFTMEHMDRSKAEEKAWKGDALLKFDDPVLHDLRVGLRLTEREAKTSQNPSGYHWQAITQPWTAGGPAYLSAFPGGTHLHTFPNFFNGKVPAPPAVVFPDVALAQGFPGSYAQLHEYGRQHCLNEPSVADKSVCNGWPFTFTPESIKDDVDSAGTNVQQERTQAAYAQLRFGFDDWKFPVDGNLGLRIVHTKASARGYTTFSGSNPNPTDTGVSVPVIPRFVQPQDFKNSYTDTLPSLNLRMKASEELQFRFAAAKAISRPDFSQLQAYTTLTQDVKRSGTEVTSVSHTGEAKGNPLLKPIRSTQVDATAEWYFSRTGSLTFAAFNKDLKDVIINQTALFSLPDVNGRPQDFVVTSPINGGKGHARGFELAFQTYFDKLPGWLSGLGMQANFTYVDSKTKLYKPVLQAWCSGNSTGAANLNLNLNGCDTDGRTFGDLPLQGLSRKAYTLTFMYDQGPLSARLAYTWRSKYLQGVNVNGTNGTDGTNNNPDSPDVGQRGIAWALPTWADDYGQLDAGIFYKLLEEKLTLGLEAQNLNDAKQRQVMQQHIGDKTRGLFYSGPRYTLTARYTF
ncbi:TonB-dependent receptor [Aquabacterium humicola]|uniref:TonB-dependent receptor n=1 Tax=Aquabacterium humicola TaxID=3237377 RepID=UPI00254388EB|nr:TonB-dependent receptor [Rubrivivax pictus]